MGASPRVETLLVEEGDRVEAGQVLARFDTHPDQLADFEVAKATIATLEQRQALLQRKCSATSGCFKAVRFQRKRSMSAKSNCSPCSRSCARPRLNCSANASSFPMVS